MKLYHGSNKNFNFFKISEDLISTPSNSLVEGMGVYMVEERNVRIAKGYGNILYTVEVENSDILDATDETELREIIQEVDRELGNVITRYVSEEDINSTIEGILEGEYSVTGLMHELFNWIDSNENFYLTYSGDTENLNKEMEEVWNELTPNIIKYYDKNYECDIFICVKNEECLKITNKQIKM